MSGDNNSSIAQKIDNISLSLSSSAASVSQVLDLSEEMITSSAANIKHTATEQIISEVKPSGSAVATMSMDQEGKIFLSGSDMTMELDSLTIQIGSSKLTFKDGELEINIGGSSFTIDGSNIEAQVSSNITMKASRIRQMANQVTQD
ncbi:MULTISPECIES: hypothetical protein [Cysteiniphilum]|uniref:DUF2345 domain-containing protein n=1 Tax=Cysteiniphilum litorale TaxID=2056700 RepID=A0A8J2Z4H8_9GAMM|nr:MULTISPECIES: hypothetical protein [Cysteiniphilum]GGF98486.1 hypothetical protein GCM10010995_14680 [Cysteiniphilum litorale]